VTPAELTPYMSRKRVRVHNGISYTLEPIHFQAVMEVTAAQKGISISPSSGRPLSQSRYECGLMTCASSDECRTAFRAGLVPNSRAEGIADPHDRRSPWQGPRQPRLRRETDLAISARC